jgi:glycosyltransferase involved in cell wall biosynthesis
VSLKIAVYSPSKNEEHNVKEWFESAQDADEILLVDTGSTDGTLHVPYSGLIVDKICISPWRFDDAFNACLALISEDIDIAVPLALDERLHPGWREELERAWEAGGRQFTYRYLWGEGLEYRHNRIHARHGYRWKYPAHECVMGPGPTAHTDVVIEQINNGTSPRRAEDGPLVHLMLIENPDDPRAMYYSARQSFYENDWTRARQIFEQYLLVSTHAQERSEACRLMSRMVWPHAEESWHLRAAAECPERREVWTDLALFYSMNNKRESAAAAATRALSITQTPSNSFHLEAWAWQDEWLQALEINT